MYQFPFAGDGFIRTRDNAWVGPENAKLLAWLDAGNTPEPIAVPSITWDDIRAKRDQLIRESDWTMIPGATVDQLAWSSYRQILRDLPQTYLEADVDSVIWPNPPSTSGPNTAGLE